MRKKAGGPGITIGRQNRTELYNPAYHKAPPIVPESLRFGVKCRTRSDGSCEQVFDNASAAEVLRKIKQAQVESIAVCFLFSFPDIRDMVEQLNLLPLNSKTASLSDEALIEKVHGKLYLLRASNVNDGLHVLSDTRDLDSMVRIFQGGMTAAVRALSNMTPKVLWGDTKAPSNPKVRELREEIERVVRGKLLNPQWIEGMALLQKDIIS